MTEKAKEVRGDSQQEYGYVKIRLGVPYRLDNKLPLELLGTCRAILLDGLEKPTSLCIGEERCILGILQISERQGGFRRLGGWNHLRHTCSKRVRRRRRQSLN